jgi:hypothetical protein
MSGRGKDSVKKTGKKAKKIVLHNAMQSMFNFFSLKK